MDVETVIPLVGASACVVYLVLIRRSIRMMREGDEEWRQRWRQLDPARRKSIRDHMKRGEVVPDREDAELAVRAVAQVDYVRKAMAPVVVGSLLLVFAFLVAGIVTGTAFLIVVGAFGLGSSAVVELLTRWQRRRYEESTVATRRAHNMDRPLPG